MISRRLFSAALLATCLPLIATGQTAPATHADGWPMITPAQAGLEAEALRELTGLIDAAVSYPNVHALLIEYRGALVFEQYWPGVEQPILQPSLGMMEHGPTTLHDIRSISKGVTSLLLGLALAESPE